METVSYILSITSLVSMIISSLLKGRNMKKILFFVFLGNALMALSYLLIGNEAGAVSCFIGAAMAIINSYFDSHNRKIPIWLLLLYIAAPTAANLMVYTGPVDILPIIASLSFVMCVLQKNGKQYRFWTIINMALWITFDILKASYGPLTTHIILTAFTVAGMLIHDMKERSKG